MVPLLTEFSLGDASWAQESLGPVLQGKSAWGLAAKLAGPPTIREALHLMASSGLKLSHPRQPRLRT
eukprot:7636176-Pyramimonas_sp.AAC.1